MFYLKDKTSYYDIKITGKDTKSFIHNLYKMHVKLLNIEFFNNYIIIKVPHSDYKKILKIKTTYKIEVIKLYGYVNLEYLLKKYFVFIVISFLGIVMFLGLTNTIFEIEVICNDIEIKELVLNELKNEGIYKYKFVVSYDKKEKIKNNILNKYKDKLEWMEIERVGVKYIVKLEERKKNNEDINNTYQNIIAKKNGLVKKIISSSGEISIQKNQYVKKGDILISGIIHNQEDIVDKVKALGTVYAEVWYTVKVELPYHYYEEVNTSNKKTLISINWFNNNYLLFDFNKYDNSTNEAIFELKNNILPMSISLINKKEVIVYDKVYTKDNAIIEASNIAKERLMEKLGKDIEILYEKNLKIEEENSKIVIVMFYKVYEDITEYQEINDIDIKTE